MAFPAYVREKARRLRVEQRLSIGEIAERLCVAKATVYYWVGDLPLERPRRSSHAGTRAMQRKFRLLREAAYEEGRANFDRLVTADPTFRDFLCMYIGEGSKRDRNVVSIANSDPRVVVLATRWMRALSRNPIRFAVQYHADQNLAMLREFWAATLDIDAAAVAMQRKTNSGQLGGRTWRSQYGVLSVRTCDTLFRARLQAWMDCLQEQWLDSPGPGRSSAW